MDKVNKFLKRIFTPLFNASLILLLTSQNSEGWVAMAYFTVACFVFVVDLLDPIKKKDK